MNGTVWREKQDLTYLRWSHMRNSSGTVGTFLKAESSLSGEKIYYKLSNFDPVRGVVGHECVNEIIVDRLLTILGVVRFDPCGYPRGWKDVRDVPLCFCGF